MGHKQIQLLPNVTLFLIHRPASATLTSTAYEVMDISENKNVSETESFLMMTDEDRSYNPTDDECFYSRSYWEAYESREITTNYAKK